MPEQPPTEPPGGPGTEVALRRIELALKSGAWELDLFNLKLSTLPEAIGQLSQLRVLDLSNNRLSTLPAVQGLVREVGEAVSPR